MQPYDFSVLRTLRQQEKLTLQAVSDRSGVSVAVISKLERNQSQAELETLFKLSRVFGMTAADLLGLAESQTATRKRASTYDSGGFTFQRVAFGNVEGYHGFANTGGKVSSPQIHGNDYEVCWVLNGAVTITLPNERHDLTAGDAVQFDAVLEHTYEATADCEIVVLHMPKGKRF